MILAEQRRQYSLGADHHLLRDRGRGRDTDSSRHGDWSRDSDMVGARKVAPTMAKTVASTKPASSLLKMFMAGWSFMIGCR